MDFCMVLDRFAVRARHLSVHPDADVMWGALLTRVPNPLTLMDLFHLVLIFAIILPS